MPAEHIQQWKHNREFVALIPKNYSDWIVTAVMYTGLHAVDALLVADGHMPESHIQRNGILCCAPRYKQIWLHYKPLYDRAHVARYSAAPTEWTPCASIDTAIIKDLLFPIETSVRKLLGELPKPVLFPAHAGLKINGG